jgi:hypothetical protein
VLRLTEMSRQQWHKNGAGELSSMRCPELGDMSSAAPRRCCETSSRGRAHTKEGHRRAPLNREVWEGSDTLCRWKSSMTDGRADKRHQGVPITARVRPIWEEGGGATVACTRHSRAGRARATGRSGAASGGVSEHGQSQLHVTGTWC